MAKLRRWRVRYGSVTTYHGTLKEAARVGAHLEINGSKPVFYGVWSKRRKRYVRLKTSLFKKMAGKHFRGVNYTTKPMRRNERYAF